MQRALWFAQTDVSTPRIKRWRNASCTRKNVVISCDKAIFWAESSSFYEWRHVYRVTKIPNFAPLGPSTQSESGKETEPKIRRMNSSLLARTRRLNYSIQRSSPLENVFHFQTCHAILVFPCGALIRRFTWGLILKFGKLGKRMRWLFRSILILAVN